MATPGDLYRVDAPTSRLSRGAFHGTRGACGLPYSVRERFEVVATRPGGPGVDGQTYDLPAARGGQSL